MSTKKGSGLMKLSNDMLENISGGFESDEIYERYDGFKMEKKESITNTAPLPCPSCGITNGIIFKGSSKEGQPAWICQACGNMHYYQK